MAYVITLIVFHILNRLTKIKYFDDTHVDVMDVYWGVKTKEEYYKSHLKDLAPMAVLLGIVFYIMDWF